MPRTWIAPSVALLALLLPGSSSAAAGLSGGYRLDYEVGPVYILQNDNRYGEGGTRFTAEEVGQQENLLIGKRLALELPLGTRNTLVLVYAPFDVNTQATLDQPVQFNETLFPAGTTVDSRYLFDGYRLSYLRTLAQQEQLVLQVGLSGQIRNAQVALTAADGSARAFESDIGVVGAVKARLFWDPLAVGGPYWMLDADAFSTFGLVGDVSGAIYDLALTCAVPVTPSVDLTFRSRLLGGGAEVPDKQIDNWGNFLAFAVGARVNLGALLD